MVAFTVGVVTFLTFAADANKPHQVAYYITRIGVQFKNMQEIITLWLPASSMSPSHQLIHN
jgi:hypothetical protein